MPVRPTRPTTRACPQAERQTDCPLVCKYNHFEADDLVIDSWELKCLDCGLRETIAFRSDEPADEEPGSEPVEPKRCPFCKRSDLPPGRNPCDSLPETS